MKSNDKNFMVMVLLLGAASLLSLGLYFKDFQQHDTVDIKNFPRAVGDWTSQEIPLSKEDLAVLETNNAFIRKYRNSHKEEVYLYIVYSQTNRKVSHPPEICYTGSGISILENTPDSIPINYKHLTIPAQRLVLEGNKFHQVAFYWFKVGDMLTANYWQQQISIALDTLLGKRKGSALIRISVNIVQEDKQTAMRTAKQFTNLIAPQLFEYLP